MNRRGLLTLDVVSASGDLRGQRVAGFGRQQAEMLQKFPDTHVLLALMRDGFLPEAPGGRVKLRGDGSPTLDYPLTDFVMDGAAPRAAGDG